MAIQKADVIVLRTTKLRETSLIVTFFSREFGKFQAISKGVRQAGSPWAGLYEPMNRLEVIFYEKFRSDIHLATEASGLDLRGDLRKNFKASAFGYYLTEILENFSNVGEPDLIYWDLIEKSYRTLSETPVMTALIFQLKLLHHSGFFPDIQSLQQEESADSWETYISSFLSHSSNSHGRSATLEQSFILPTHQQVQRLQYLIREDWDLAFRLQMTEEEMAQDEAWVSWLIAAKLEKKLRSRRFIEEVLNL